MRISMLLLLGAATAQSPTLIADLVLGPFGIEPHSFTEIPSTTLFYADQPEYGLWRTDGTAAGTLQLAAWANAIDISELWPVGDGAIFFVRWATAAPVELWITDGTPAGTVAVGVPAGLTNATAGTVVGDRVFFAGQHTLTGEDYWVTDGTLAGTHIIRDFVPWTWPLERPISIGYRAVFAANGPTVGNELWMSNGTAGTTWLIRDINPGQGSGIGRRLECRHGDYVYFNATGSGGSGLWRSNGTLVGTNLFYSGTQGVTFGVGDYIYVSTAHLTAIHRETGVGHFLFGGCCPWLYNHRPFRGGVLFTSGTTAFWSGGPGGGGSFLSPPSVSFAAGDWFQPTGSRFAYYPVWPELWRTDGLASGTSMVASVPSSHLALCHGKLFFRGIGPSTGPEPWVLDVGASSRAVGQGLGNFARVPSLTMTDPVLGASTTLSLDAGYAGATIVLQLSLGPVAARHLWPDAWGWFGQSWIDHRFLPMTGYGWQWTLPVPNVAALGGIDFVCQAALFGTGAQRGFELSNAAHGVLGN